MERELRRRGRLARALEAGEQDHRRRPARERELRAPLPHQLGQLLVDDLHDLLAGRQALQHLGAERACLHAHEELLDDLEVDVGLEQREADLAQRLVEILLGEDPAVAQARENALELVGERVEHGFTLYGRGCRALVVRAVRPAPAASATSTSRHRAFTSCISSIERQRASSSLGEQTSKARHCAREIATLRRLRENRNARLRGTSSPLRSPSRRRRPAPSCVPGGRPPNLGEGGRGTGAHDPGDLVAGLREPCGAAALGAAARRDCLPSSSPSTTSPGSSRAATGGRGRVRRTSSLAHPDHGVARARGQGRHDPLRRETRPLVRARAVRARSRSATRSSRPRTPRSGCGTCSRAPSAAQASAPASATPLPFPIRGSGPAA